MLQDQMIPIGGLYTQDSQAFHRGVLDDCSRTLKADTHDAGVMCEVAVKEVTKQGLDMANTLDTSCNQGIFVQISENLTVYAVWYPKKQCYIAIRKLTPKECFRLQGWTDDYFAKAQLVNSDSQLYKQAGNGVTVNVICAIAEKMETVES